MSKIFNDSIHGTITLHPLLIKIIDTPQFQRLRNIKQLGGCYFVYPSASHNRFEHSIGTCFLASKLAHQLRARLEEDKMDLKKDKKLSNDMKEKYLKKFEEATMTDNDILCIEIAGLCHDIGHGPFSHLFDRLFNKAIHKKHKTTKEWEHEDVSGDMLDYLFENNPDVRHEFEKTIIEKTIIEKTIIEETIIEKTIICDFEWYKNFIKDLIKGKPSSPKKKNARSYMYEIVANKRNEIDVDKMDYFARDCHGLGMKSNFDHLRFISQCRVMFLERSDNPDESTIAVRDKEEYNLYELFQTRIGLFRSAYYHRVNKAIELMLTDALVLANDHLPIPTDKSLSGKTVKMSEAYQDMSAYEKLTDSIVDVILMSTNEKLTEAKTLIKRIYKRQLYKCVGSTAPKQELTNDNINKIEEKLKENGFHEEDFRVQKLSFNCGKGLDNPIEYVYFYEKDGDNYYECYKGKDSKETSMLLPSTFQEDFAFIYSTSMDTETTKNLKRKWKIIQNTLKQETAD
ncbi:deoxynucleoside triphosphate triphosphohydrolase SAMHD1-like [Mytilus edulis]|uniref:deoxynucleoside triphosphate triphosphohydrolase SAMHD1-like n=1 Tax=Mytilus edulis TaxID=6550 RepID=UPI0039EF83F9